MSMRMAALQKLHDFFDHLSGARHEMHDPSLQPDASHHDPKVSRKHGVQEEHGESPVEETEEDFGGEAFDDGSEDGVMNSDPQRKDAKMPESEKPKGDGIPKMPDKVDDKKGKLDIKEVMRKAGRTGSGSKGRTMNVGAYGNGK